MKPGSGFLKDKIDIPLARLKKRGLKSEMKEKK